MTRQTPKHKPADPERTTVDHGAQLREMILGALEELGGQAGAEAWLRENGGEHLIPRYRLARKSTA